MHEASETRTHVHAHAPQAICFLLRCARKALWHTTLFVP